MQKTSTKIKIISFTTMWLFATLAAISAYYAADLKSSYSIEQFLPKDHPVLRWDQESKKVFHISETAPHIVLLSSRDKSTWNQPDRVEKLSRLTKSIEGLKNVKSVISLGNIQAAFQKKDELLVGSLNDLRKQGFDLDGVLNDSLYTPHLISKDGRHTAIFVMPEDVSQVRHKRLIAQLKKVSQDEFPKARVQVGGPAAIRTELIDLLGSEIVRFIALSLLAALLVSKFMFHGWLVLAPVSLVLLITNLLALGVMAWMGISFTILSTTLPILVTVCSLGVCNHTLVRMAPAAHLPYAERIEFLKRLLRELFGAHLICGGATAVGFATLIPSDVALISEYGKIVSVGVVIAYFVPAILIPNIFLWVSWPAPRDFVSRTPRFAHFVVRHARWLAPTIGIASLIFFVTGMNLSWTSRLFDDLPHDSPVRRTTDLISQKLGGVASVDFMVGSSRAKDNWKKPDQVKKLQQFSRRWRTNRDVGSVLTVADFLATGEGKTTLPKKREAIAELQFLYSMSGESPLKQFLSSDEKWTRVAVRLPDLPADRNRAIVEKMRQDLERRFPHLDVKVSGFASMVPPINDEISKMLMWGFFEALFWIVLMLTAVFRSLRWALAAVIPNMIPPAILLGFLALFDVPIKPGIAMIFAISLGLAFDNTIYILTRLHHLLKSSPKHKMLPVFSVMRTETTPCLVSSLALAAGFAIFLFSSFPVNKMFGAFMLISVAAGLLGDLVWMPALFRSQPWLWLEKGESMLQGLSLRWQRAARVSPYLILMVLGLIAFRSAYAAGKVTNVEELLKSVEEKAAPPSERVQLKMVIQESDGSKKERELSILRKNNGEARALIRLQKPSDLKGLSLLTVASGDKEDQWLYLPSDKKSRRILGSNKKGKFLDSEIAYEDLRISTYREFDNKILREDAKTIQLESKAKPDTESSYGKLVTWIAKPDMRIEKVDYYDTNGKLLKRAQFKSYQKVGDKFWRARQVQVHNVQDNRKTSLIVKKVSVKAISDDEVSLGALEE